MYIDSHAHYDLKHFNANRWKLLAECKKIGIEKILVPAILIESNNSMMQKLDYKENTILEIPDIYYAVGVHPTRVWKGTEEHDELWEEIIRRAAKREKVIAIGEIGLDFHYEMTPEMIQRQMYWFHKQLQIAQELELPLVLHIRMADEAAIPVLKQYPLAQSGVVHCFNGCFDIAKEYLDMGLYLGIGGSMTLESATEMREALKYIPLNRILMETDAPYVKPVWCLDDINTSLTIPRMVQELAEIKGISAREVEQVTTENFLNLFGRKDF